MNQFNTDEGRVWLTGLLRDEVVKVSFLKKDGSLREMMCTLKEDLVQSYEKKTDKVKVVNTDILPVWDVDKKEWRSFRYDSISAIEFGVYNSIYIV